MSRTRLHAAPRRTVGAALIALAIMASVTLPAAAASAGASAPAPAGNASAAAKKATPAAPVELIDINSASRAQLKTLPGIGDAEADKIIAGRPYLSKAELVSKNVLPTGPYLSIRKRIIAMQKSPPKAKP
jgi:competence protein ComEA